MKSYFKKLRNNTVIESVQYLTNGLVHNSMYTAVFNSIDKAELSSVREALRIQLTDAIFDPVANPTRYPLVYASTELTNEIIF